MASDKRNGGTLFAAVLIIVIIALAVLIIRDVVTEDDTYYPGLVTVSGTATPTPQPDLRPTAGASGLLPVFYSANTSEKRVALTVQSLPGESALETLLGGCATFNAKITFFVTGEELKKYPEIWQLVMLGGHEVESRGLSGTGTTLMTNAELETELDGFTLAAQAYLSPDYAPHFYRPSELADYEDARLHSYLGQRWYYGVGSFSLMSPSSLEQFEGGTVVNVNLSEYGVSTFLTMVNALSQDGWEMVTFNRLFEYEENIISTEESA